MLRLEKHEASELSSRSNDKGKGGVFSISNGSSYVCSLIPALSSRSEHVRRSWARLEQLFCLPSKGD